MSTTEAQDLLERLIKIAPTKALKRHARMLRARSGENPMPKIIAKIPPVNGSIADKADTLGVARQTVYGWLDGTMRPNWRRSKQIARLTGVDATVIRGLGGA